MQPGDIIISLDNQKTNDANGVLSIAAKLAPEKAYPVTVVRNGQTLDVRIVAGKRPGPVRADHNPKPISRQAPKPLE